MALGQSNITTRLPRGIQGYNSTLRSANLLSFDYVIKSTDPYNGFNLNPLIILSGEDENGNVVGTNLRLLYYKFRYVEKRTKKVVNFSPNPGLVKSFLFNEWLRYYYDISEDPETKTEKLRRRDKAIDYLPKNISRIFPSYGKMLGEALWRVYKPEFMRNIRNFNDTINEVENIDWNMTINLLDAFSSDSPKSYDTGYAA